MAGRDTIYVISSDTVFLVKETIDAYSRTLSSIEAIGTWVGIIVGLFAVVVTGAIALFGIKWFGDRAAIAKEIDQAINRSRLDFEASIQKHIDSTARQSKNDLLDVWHRNIVTTPLPNQDLYAFYKGLSYAAELKNEDDCISILLALEQHAREKLKEAPRYVGDYYWNATIKKAFERVRKSFPDRRTSEGTEMAWDIMETIESLTQGKT